MPDICLKKIIIILFISIIVFFIPNQVNAFYSPVTSSSSTTLAPNHFKPTVKTSDGILHSFLQIGTETVTCSGNSKSGLIYFRSADNGVTWNCVDQISSDTTNLMYADVVVDSSNNIFVVYSTLTTGANSAYDVFIEKLLIQAQAFGVWEVNK